MPDFEYRGPSPGMFPMLRDSFGVPAGTVKPGDVMRLDEDPGADWVPYGGGGDTGDGDGGTQDGTGGEAGTEQDTDDTAGPGQEED